MSSQFIKIALCIGLLTTAAAGIKNRPSDLVKVKVTVLDKNGRSLTDVGQSEFAFTVDGASHEIDWWMKETDFSHRATYTLGFHAAPNTPATKHRIEIRVKRQDAQLRYPSALEY